MTYRPLPGDPDRRQMLHRALRVDHAGEFGAKRIYDGQLAVLRGTPSETLIQHMAEQEHFHLAFFEQELTRRRVRPTLLHPFWNIAGFALGAATALMGEKAAMACTAAVEEVIDRHYAEQVEKLADEPELAGRIEQFRREEGEHHDTAIEAGAEQAPGYKMLARVIKLGCRVAIAAAERV